MKIKLYARMLIAVMALTLSACGNQGSRTVSPTESPVETEPAQTAESSADTQAQADETEVPQRNAERLTADDLTLEQKVGQLFILRPDSLVGALSSGEINDADADGVTAVNDEVIRTLQTYTVGGVCLFQKNILSPAQVKQFNADLQEAAEIPMLIAVDEEGGIVARLANHSAFDLPKYRSAAAVAASGDEDDAYEMGETIGSYLIEYGFNVDFAPDADVNTNPDNPIIGTRAFSSNAKTAAKMVRAAAQGFRTAGILPTLKHFPGHGDTAEDSHSSLAVTHKTLKELQECEFLPFAADDGNHCVMVGHIAAPKVTGTDIPASLSEEMIRLIPNREDCLIVTDSLSMQAITDTYSSAEAAVLALTAGCDLLLMPEDFVSAYDAVLRAVRDGQISEARLDESVNKILRYKEMYAA